MLKKLKIGPKLLISFLLVSIISSTAGVVSLFLLKDADTKYSNALINYGFPQGDVGLLMNAFTDNNKNIMLLMAADDASILSEAQENIQKNVELISKYGEAVSMTLMTDAERAYYETISANLPEFTEHAQEVIALALEGKDEEAMRIYQEEAKEHVEAISGAIQGLMDSNRTIGAELSDQLTASANLMIILLASIVAAALVISVALSVYVARSVARPLGACSDRLVALSKGDLTSAVPTVDSRDETGVLAEAAGELVARLNAVIRDMTAVLGQMAEGNFNVSHEREYNGDFAPLHTSTVKIINSLNEAMTQISQSSDQVSGGADQVSAGAQALSQGATEQASSIEQLAATIGEISSQVRKNAQGAQDTNRLVGQVAGQLEESEQRMEEMTSAMKEISESSADISRIIKTIEDISFQTNILALNASVEAARAGAAGKGFSVVADEVRNLAMKSQGASKDTAALIERSLKAVEHGSQIVDETAASFVAVVEGTREITGGINAIASANDLQAQSIEQVEQGVDQISSVVQTNSATAEQSAAASEELSGQAQLMKELVGRFRLRETRSAR